MTEQTHPSPARHERDQASPSSKLGDFLNKFNARYGSRYISGPNGDRLRDMQTQATNDLPAALKYEDPQQAADQAQKIFEGDWNISDEYLKRERLAALHEIHLDTYGGEIPADRKAQAWKDTQSVISEYTPSQTEKEDGYTRAQVGDIISTIFMSKGGVKEIESAIDFIETMINEENVLRPDGERIESLRITRDQLFERFDRELTYQEERQDFIEEFMGVVGENSDFPREKVETMFGPRFADSAGLEEARTIIAMAKAAAERGDDQEKMALMRLLRDSEDKPKTPEQLAEWLEKRNKKKAAREEAERERRAAKARRNVDEALTIIENPQPKPPETMPTGVTPATDTDAETTLPVPPPYLDVALPTVPTLSPLTETATITPPRPERPPPKRVSLENPDAQKTPEQIAEEIMQTFQRAGNILRHHTNHQVIGEIIREIAAEQSRGQDEPVDPKLLDQRLKARIEGKGLPGSLNPASVHIIERKIKNSDWPKANSEVWHTGDPHSLLGKANRECRADLKRMLVDLLK